MPAMSNSRNKRRKGHGRMMNELWRNTAASVGCFILPSSSRPLFCLPSAPPGTPHASAILLRNIARGVPVSSDHIFLVVENLYEQP